MPVDKRFHRGRKPAYYYRLNAHLTERMLAILHPKARPTHPASM